MIPLYYKYNKLLQGGVAMTTLDTENVDYESEETEVDLSSSLLGSGGEEDGLNSALQIKSKIRIKQELINIDDIVTSSFKKISREKSLIGLSGVVGEWGVVTPIHVMRMEDDDMYMLFDGLRRTFAALRAGKTEIPAMVWDFDDKQEGKDKANLLGLMINRSQKHRNKELWEQMQILEEVNGASPGLIEFLLQMQPGDAMKMKDVMLSDMEYSEIRQDLMDDISTIDGAYKKLTNERRKENRLAKEDALVLEGGVGATSPDEVSDEQHLSVDAVKDILDLTNIDIEEESLESLNRSGEARGEGEEPFVQDRKNGDSLDPELRKQVLIRDKFTCQCCNENGEGALGILAVHHIVEVSQGGPDTLDNLVTLCVNCHLRVHLYAWGRVYVNLDTLDEKDKTKYKKIFKYGNVIIEADKRIGRTKEQAMKEGKSNVRHPFPGEGLKDNTLAYNSAQAKKSEEE